MKEKIVNEIFLFLVRLAAADAGKCWSESSSSSSQLAAAHRVTFSSTNEVAREAR